MLVVGQNDPAGQVPHAAKPGVGATVPTAQAVQAVDPAAEKVPAPHDTGALDAAAGPDAVHLVGGGAVHDSLKVPSAFTTHTPADEIWVNSLTARATPCGYWEVCTKNASYLPAISGHSRQELAPLVGQV